MRYADLHVHTFYSDSTFSPEEVLSCAEKNSLSAIAICDHDSVDGIGPCIEIGSALGIEVIPGIELTVEKQDVEIHILGYFIDWKDAGLQQKLREIQNSRVVRIHKMVERLKEFNIDVDAQEVLKVSGRGSVGRLHLAQVMLKNRKIGNLREAFDRYIGFMKPCYVSNIRFTPQEAIGTIRSVGGVAVLAHPAVMNRDDYIPELAACGLKGIEVYHTDHSSKLRRHYEEIAQKYKLLSTGGSDCHGMGKGRVLMGSVKVPYELVEKLKEEAKRD